MASHNNLGKLGESIARDFLISKGMIIREQNWRFNHLEIDIIAEEDGYLCFIEVKYRESDTNGFPEEAVDYRKAKRITRSAIFYMTRHGIPDDYPVRFDVVAILGNDIKVIKNAFDAVM